jgi:hypothetical protein
LGERHERNRGFCERVLSEAAVLGHRRSLYSTYFGHFIDALRASWLWLIMVGVFTGFASWQQWSWMAAFVAKVKPIPPFRIQQPTEMALLLNLDNILMLLAGVSIAVAWHRLMILNEQPSVSGSNVATKKLWRYVVAAIALFLIMFLPVIAVMLPTFYFLLPAPPVRIPPPLSPPSGLLPLFLLMFVVYAVGTAVTLRLTLLLPAQAVGDTRLTIRQTWNRTRGNTWRLFWGIVACTVPPLLLVESASLTMIGAPNPATFASGDFAAKMTTMSTVFAIYYLLILPIGIGFLSHAYRHFFQAPAR